MKLIDILVTVLSSVFLFIIILTTILVKTNRNNKIHNKKIQNKIEEEEKWIEIIYNYYIFQESFKKSKDKTLSIEDFRSIIHKNIKKQIISNDENDKNDENDENDENNNFMYYEQYKGIKNTFENILVPDYKDFIREQLKEKDIQDISVKDAIWEKTEGTESVKTEYSSLEKMVTKIGRKVKDYITIYQPLFELAKEEVLKEQQKPTLGGFIKFIKKINKKNKQTRKSKNNNKSKNIKSKKTNKK